MTMASVEDLSSVDIENVCRICLAKRKNMKNIFDGESKDVVEKILFCSGVLFKKEPGLSRLVCETCLKNLSIAYKFKTTCILAEESIKKIILNNVKIEKLDYEDYCIEDLDELQYDNDLKEIVDLKKESNGCDNKDRSKDIICKLKLKNETDIRLEPKPYQKGDTISIKVRKFRRLHCAACDIQFKSKDQLQEHKKQCNKESGSICEICGKVFAQRAAMYNHRRLHQEACYKCENCSYSTPIKADLKKHMYIHTDVKLFQCTQCPLSYKTSSNLSFHVQSYHKGLRRYPCTMCEKRFADSTKLKRHIDSHNSIKRYECQECHSHFTRRCHWKRHLLKQHGIFIPRAKPGPQKMNESIEKLCTSLNKSV